MTLASLFEQMATSKLDVYSGIVGETLEITPTTRNQNSGVVPKPAPEIATTPTTPITPKSERLINSGSPWSKEETAHTIARTALFIKKGQDYNSADILACNLVTRDREMDDRSSCFECQHFLYACTLGLKPLGGDHAKLHRCIKFLEDSYDRTA